MAGERTNPGRVGDLLLRRYEEADLDQVLALLQASLGWGSEADYRALFQWKHEQNPFGPSPAWVAVAGGQVVGFRTFLRWELEHRGQLVRAVRAVDTATHPDHQGRGIFSRLTLQALDELRAEGVDLVFNTPNASSRPGYLKMGWQAVGRLPVSARPRSLTSLGRLARARTPAARWSEPCQAGSAAAEVLADDDMVASLLASRPASTGLRTRLSPEFLRWRYGFGPLRYRALADRSGPAGALALFRLRRRGPALEAALCGVFGPEGGPQARLERAVARLSGADVVVRIGAGSLRRGFLPVPGQGPTLLVRPLDGGPAPPLGDWDLDLGDVELF